MVVAPRELVGRAGELQHIDALLQQARLGQGGVLTFSGEPGLGKTSLLDEARRRATDFAVIECGGVEWEAEFPFSALHELLRPLDLHLDRLPAPQRRELDAAFGRGDGGAVQGFHAYAAALSLVLEATRDQPVLVIVDDLQWIDAVSAQAISFVGRRIGGDPVAILVATRPGGRLPGLPESRQVTPLSRAAVGELAAREIGHALPDASIDALTRASGGNPLAVVESAAHAGDRLWLQGSGLDELLPVGALIEQRFAERLDGLSPDALLACTVVAVSVSDDDDLIRAAVASCGVSPAALTEAHDQRVLVSAQGRWRFAHPLLRSVAHRRATAAQRRRAHASLALGAREEALAAWHAAAASPEPNAEVADRLVRAATRHAEIGGALAAALALERAAELTPDPTQAAERLVEAARAARFGGAPITRVLALTDRAAAMASDPGTTLRAECEALIARVLTEDAGPLSDAMLELADRAIGVDDYLAVTLLRGEATEGVLLGDAPRTRRALDRLQPMLNQPQFSQVQQMTIQAPLHGYALLHGGGAEHEAALERLGREYVSLFATGTARVREFGGSVFPVAEGLTWMESFELGEEIVRTFLEGARAQGDAMTEMIACTYAAQRSLRLGRWAEALDYVARGCELAELMGVTSTKAVHISVAAMIQGARTGHANEVALAEADRSAADGTPFVEEYTSAARGTTALANGEAAEAATHLERARRWRVGAGYVEPCAGTWPVDLVQAHILAGDAERARERLAELRDYAETTQRRWALAAVPWLEAMLTEDDTAAFAQFEVAISRYPEARAPFEEARARLAYGQRLRRANRRADARVQLEAALATFEHLQAEPWAQRARRELGASGKGVRRAATHERDELTLQERQVAALIAAGATNKEAAGELFLSPKTIESHLSRIYRKLGVSSRTQLAARWNELGGG